MTTQYKVTQNRSNNNNIRYGMPASPANVLPMARHIALLYVRRRRNIDCDGDNKIRCGRVLDVWLVGGHNDRCVHTIAQRTITFLLWSRYHAKHISNVLGRHLCT